MTATTATTATIPGPKGRPLQGMAHELRRDLLGTLLSNFERFGDLVRYGVGPSRGPRWLRASTVAVHHPDGVQQVLTEDEVFTRDTVSYRVLAEMFGQNLVTTDGEVWRRQRRTLQPLFTLRQVESYAPLMEAEARAVVNDRTVASGEPVDLAKLMEGYALRVLGHTLFKGERAIDDETVAALGRLVPLVSELVPSRARQTVRLPLAWPTARNRRFAQAHAQLYATVERVLARRAAAAGADAVDDLLSRLQQAREPDTGEPLSEQEVRDQALVFLLAGHTTSSNALTSTLHLLASNLEVQEQVAEAAAGSAGPGSDGELVRAALQEGMRLYPPSSVLARRVATDTEIDGHAIGAGATVLVSAWVTHRHPNFWPRPERFDPGRFVGEQRRPPYAYFPFGGGGRTCIGRHFALIEAGIMVRELLRAYRLVAVGEISMGQRISLRPTEPVLVRCQRR